MGQIATPKQKLGLTAQDKRFGLNECK